MQPISYKRHRYPAAISQCVWLYFRFAWRFRHVSLTMAERGVVVTYESVRAWCKNFGRPYAQKIRRQRGRMGDVWHLNEVYLKINRSVPVTVACSGPRGAGAGHLGSAQKGKSRR